MLKSYVSTKITQMIYNNEITLKSISCSDVLAIY